MEIAAKRILKAIKDLLNDKYEHIEEETDFSQCYTILNLPDGSTGYKVIYDEATCGTGAPVRHGIVKVAGLTFTYTNDGTDDGDDNEIFLNDANGETVSFSDVEIIDVDEVEISDDLRDEVDDVAEIDCDTDDDDAEWLGLALEGVFTEKFLYPDTWDIEPDDIVGEDEGLVDIEDCNRVETNNEGTCTCDGTVYYIVSEDVDPDDIDEDYDDYDDEDDDEDDESTLVYAVEEGTPLENDGYYETVYVLRLSESGDVINVYDTCLRYNSVEMEIES